MKKLLIILLALILFASLLAYNNSNPKVIISRLLTEEAIPKGELRYKIYLFGIIPAGEATLSMEKIEQYKGDSVYHLNAVARSSPVFAKFFNAQAILNSYIDKERLLPVHFSQKVTVSSKPDMHKEVYYDQNNGVMSIAGVKRQILADTHDPLSAIFNIRRMNFDNVNELELNINTNQKNYVLKGSVTKNEILLNKESHKIIVVRAKIKRRDNNPYHQSSISMVLLERERNLPVLIKVFASGVFINAKLISVR